MFQMGRSVTHEVDGRKYTFSRLELHVIEEFRDWIKEQEGDPLDWVKGVIDHVPPDEAKRLIAEALLVRDQLRAFSIGCPLSQKYLKTEVGLGRLVFLLLRGAHPEITTDEAFHVFMTLGARAAAEVVRETSGSPPNGEAPPAEAARGHTAPGTGTPSSAG